MKVKVKKTVQLAVIVDTMHCIVNIFIQCHFNQKMNIKGSELTNIRTKNISGEQK